MVPNLNPEEKPQISAEADEKRTPDIHPLHAAVMREMADPTDGFEPTPVWLLLFYFAIAGSAGWYLATYAAEFRSGIYDERPAAAYAGLSTQKVVAVDPKVLGKRIFNNCTQCHQDSGLGQAGVYPPLVGSEWVSGPPEILARILLNGLNENVTVRGAIYNGQMPAWGSRLKDEQIAAVLTYIRSSWSNQSSVVSPELIAGIRKETAGRTGSWTESELKAIAGKLTPTASIKK